jgi:hypothetical protein
MSIKNILLKKRIISHINLESTPQLNSKLNTQTILESIKKNNNFNIYILINDDNEIENKYLVYLNEIINLDSTFNSIIIKSFDNLLINSEDFLITHNKTNEKYNFKNIIRWFIKDFIFYHKYDTNEILLFNAQKINDIYIQNKHPDIINLYIYSEIVHNQLFYINFNKNNDVVNINIFNENINKYRYLDCVRFTDPLINIFNNNGIYKNNINVEYDLFDSSIEFIYSNKLENEDILLFTNDDNVIIKIINNNNILKLFIDNKIYDILNINNNNDINKIQISINKNNIIYNSNNKIYFINHDIINKNINKINICNDINLYDLKIYNYCIPIYQNKILDIYPKYHINKFNNPKSIYQNNNNTNNTIINTYDIKIYTIFLILKKVADVKIGNLHIYNKNNVFHINYNDNIICSHNTDEIVNNIIITHNFNKSIIKINNKIYKINTDLSIVYNNIIHQDCISINITNYDIIDNLLFEELDTTHLINLFNIFGFIKINKLLINDNEKLIKAFEYNVNHYAKNISDYIPCAMEYLSVFVNIILNKKIHTILNKIFNKKYYYNGSDSKIYSSDTNWHCDRKTKNLHLKVAIYLDKLDKTNGCLNVLPGSNHTNDIYSSILSKNVIPLFNGSGGFKNNFLNDKDIPYLSIENSYGDIVIFDLGLYHSAFNNQYNKKMICMNYAEYYDDINDAEKIECINSDCFIIANLKKNINMTEKINTLDNNFYKYILNTKYYEMYFKELIENNNKLDYFIRLIKSDSDKTELNEFIKKCNNTNSYKTNQIIKINNHIY